MNFGPIVQTTPRDRHVTNDRDKYGRHHFLRNAFNKDESKKNRSLLNIGTTNIGMKIFGATETNPFANISGSH